MGAIPFCHWARHSPACWGGSLSARFPDRSDSFSKFVSWLPYFVSHWLLSIRKSYQLDDHLILTLNETAGVLARRDVLEGDIALCGAKERDPGADEYGNASDNKASNESGLKKPLDSDPTIYVNMSDAACGKLRHNLGRGAGHPLHHSPDGGGRDGARAENENGFGAIGPRVKAQDRLECIAANDQRI